MTSLDKCTLETLPDVFKAMVPRSNSSITVITVLHLITLTIFLVLVVR
jgi:hypothetical protein